MSSGREELVTPKFVATLGPDEVFVFGCRNSGRHFDGASAFALEHFGAVFGQREGMQGRSYAIPTIGGSIRLKDIEASVARFTQYAAEHPELHFLVTPVGCGGGGWTPRQIAPLFRKASLLRNVSLPAAFWDELNRPAAVIVKRWLDDRLCDAKMACGALRYMWMRMAPAESLYKYLTAKRPYEYDLREGLSVVVPNIDNYAKSIFIRCLLNHNTKRAYMIVDSGRRLLVSRRDIDWDSVRELPEKAKARIMKRDASLSFEIGKYNEGLARVAWQVSPDGRYHYIDKFGNGFVTDERIIRIYGMMDTECRFVEKLHFK